MQKLCNLFPRQIVCIVCLSYSFPACNILLRVILFVMPDLVGLYFTFKFTFQISPRQPEEHVLFTWPTLCLYIYTHHLNYFAFLFFPVRTILILLLCEVCLSSLHDCSHLSGFILVNSLLLFLIVITATTNIINYMPSYEGPPFTLPSDFATFHYTLNTELQPQPHLPRLQCAPHRQHRCDPLTHTAIFTRWSAASFINLYFIPIQIPCVHFIYRISVICPIRFHMLDAQLCLPSHPVPQKTQCVSVTNAIPSSTALTSQKTHKLLKIFENATKWLTPFSTSRKFSSLSSPSFPCIFICGFLF